MGRMVRDVGRLLSDGRLGRPLLEGGEYGSGGVCLPLRGVWQADGG